MRPVLLAATTALVSALVPTAPASAQMSSSDSHFNNGPSARPAPFSQERRFGDFRFACGGSRHDGRHHRDGRRDRFDGCDFFGAGWGYYDPDINRSWDSDSYNSWWHDRPDRAYPRWVQEQRGREA
jgi:hypothetical protein